MVATGTRTEKQESKKGNDKDTAGMILMHLVAIEVLQEQLQEHFKALRDIAEESPLISIYEIK